MADMILPSEIRKTCPVCGSPAKARGEFGGIKLDEPAETAYINVTVRCSNHKCPMAITAITVEAWNTMPDVVALRAEVERLRALREKARIKAELTLHSLIEEIRASVRQKFEAEQKEEDKCAEHTS